ncbi:hypothetical protein SAMN02745111_02152 [Eubacterium uniforme]|uniref:Uncharacterized protein n=1 Tax=Eubacterium uniforme TaxID=39495 RepID=A0A1T4W1K2_9FIRM|nr:hypothetical protein [Eubacterium uniforme]SKA71067.1 hypothetical protein SAMN02745111_02152 [Eubacterium uniforme]
MKIINLSEKKDKSTKRVSLCYKLEAIIGNYHLAGAGLDDIETLYYDSDMGIDDAISLSKDKIVAYFLENESFAFVRMDLLTKLKADTEEFDIKYIPVKNFETEVLNKELLEEYFDKSRKIEWIDDDFMNDDSIEFDYEAFEIIESGIKYLNPKHFSVNQLISSLNA